MTGSSIEIKIKIALFRETLALVFLSVIVNVNMSKEFTEKKYVPNLTDNKICAKFDRY